MTKTRRQLLTAVGAGFALEGLHLALGLGLGGCGGSTTGELIELQAAIRSDVPAGGSFVNQHGWTVTLTKCQVALAAFHLFDDEEPSLAQRVLGVKSAFAHAGHIESAGIRGEMIEPALVDLTAGPVELGSARGVSGHVGSGHVQFDAEALGGWAVVLEGVAERDGEERRFLARAAVNELLSAHGDAEVFGCPVNVDEVNGDGRVELVACVSQWLDDVAFAMQPASDDMLELDHAVGTHDAFVVALRDAEGWPFMVESA